MKSQLSTERKRVEKLLLPSKAWRLWVKFNTFWKPYEIVLANLRRKIWNIKTRLLELRNPAERLRLKIKLRKLKAKEKWVRRRVRGTIESIFR